MEGKRGKAEKGKRENVVEVDGDLKFQSSIAQVATGGNS